MARRNARRLWKLSRAVFEDFDASDAFKPDLTPLLPAFGRGGGTSQINGKEAVSFLMFPMFIQQIGILVSNDFPMH